MKILNCDAMEMLGGLPEGSADLCVLDPDYQDWDALLDRGLVSACVRVLKATGNILCFTKEPFDLRLRNDLAPIYRREIVWTFCNGGAWSSPRMPLLSHQKIYWAAPRKAFFFNPRTGLGYSSATRDSFKRTSKVFAGSYEEGRVFEKSEGGTWIRDHYHYNKPQCGAVPAKPKALIEILVRCFSPTGGLVVDPFAGGGVVADVCIAEGRDYVGSEIKPDLCRRINSRLVLANSTLNLDFSQTKKGNNT